MKILHLTRDLPPRTTGGISSAVGGLVRALAQAGADSQVVSFDGWRPKAKAGHDDQLVEHHTSEGRVLRVTSPSAAEQATTLMASTSLDLVHVHDGLLWQWSERLGRPSLPRVLTTHVLQHELNHLRGVTRPTMSSEGQEVALVGADWIIAPSASAAANLRSCHPTLGPRISQIGFGVKPVTEIVPRTSPPLILYVGRFSDVKGIDELVTAAPMFLAAHPTLQLAVVGGNPESPRTDRRWRRRLTEAVPESSAHRLHLAGWLDAQDVAGWQDRAWLQLCPSWTETFGLAAAEAMARGLPVVGTDAGALPELLVDGLTGRLVPVRDPEAMITAVLDLVADDDRRELMAREALLYVAERCRWQDVAAKHLELYELLLGSSKSIGTK